MIEWMRKDGNGFVPRDPEDDEWVRILKSDDRVDYYDGGETQIVTVYYEVQT